MTVRRRAEIAAATQKTFFFFLSLSLSKKRKYYPKQYLVDEGVLFLNRSESLADPAGPTELVYKLSQVSSARREKASLLAKCKPDRGQVGLYSPHQHHHHHHTVSAQADPEKDEAATSAQAVSFRDEEEEEEPFQIPKERGVAVHLQVGMKPAGCTGGAVLKLCISYFVFYILYLLLH